MIRRFCVCFVVVFSFHFYADGQVIGKGTWIVDGAGYYNHNFIDDSKFAFSYRDISNINYSAGLFLTSKLLMQFQSSHQVYLLKNNIGKGINRYFQHKINLSYYFNTDIPKRIKYFLSGSLGAHGSLNNNDEIFSDRPLKVIYNLGIGADYLINNNMVFSNRLIYLSPPGHIGSFNKDNNINLSSSLKALFGKSESAVSDNGKYQSSTRLGDVIIGGTNMLINYGWRENSSGFRFLLVRKLAFSCQNQL